MNEGHPAQVELRARIRSDEGFKLRLQVGAQLAKDGLRRAQNGADDDLWDFYHSVVAQRDADTQQGFLDLHPGGGCAGRPDGPVMAAPASLGDHVAGNIAGAAEADRTLGLIQNGIAHPDALHVAAMKVWGDGGSPSLLGFHRRLQKALERQSA